MSDGTIVTLISLGVTVLFMLGTPVLLVIFYWSILCSLLIGLPLDNTGNELLNVFKDGFALLAMPLFILTGDLINKSGIAKRLSDFAYACLGWLRWFGDGRTWCLRPLCCDLRVKLSHNGNHWLYAVS